MVDQLQERIEREARFNSDVSHELRSPLTTLGAAVDVLEADRDRLPERSQRALALLSDDLRRFQRMVSDLLEMSRVDAGSADFFLEEVNVSELVQRSVETGIGHMDARRYGTPDVYVDPAVEHWRVGVDKRRFERVIVNLMENADHYGGGATTIAVGPGAEAEAVVAMRTSGGGDGRRRRAGHRPGRAGQSFERFYRGSASGRRGTGTGTGLGLALVAEHVRVMHGGVGSSRRPTAEHASCCRCRCSKLATATVTAMSRGTRGWASKEGRVARRCARGGAGVWPSLPRPLAVFAAGCAIPTQGSPSSIAASRVPFHLLDPHPPATTTTTQPKPSSYVGVKVFLLNATSNSLTPTDRLVSAQAPLTAIITSLVSGPTIGDSAAGLTTAIPSDVVVLSAATTAPNVVTVDFNETFGQITGTATEQRWRRSCPRSSTRSA